MSKRSALDCGENLFFSGNGRIVWLGEWVRAEQIFAIARRKLLPPLGFFETRLLLNKSSGVSLPQFHYLRAQRISCLLHQRPAMVNGIEQQTLVLDGGGGVTNRLKFFSSFASSQQTL